MSLRSARSILREFNAALTVHKLAGVKPNVGATSDALISKDISLINQKLNTISLWKSQTERILPILDVPTKKTLIEPNKNAKLHFELPIRNSNVVLELPFHIKKEIIEPGKVISKRAVHILRIRKKKMRKHKRKKYQRKYKVELAQRKLHREIQKEENFQNSLRVILNEKDNFSAENYVTETLKKAHWQPPVTRVRGRLAPQFVIKEYLKNKEIDELLRERIKECSE